MEKTYTVAREQLESNHYLKMEKLIDEKKAYRLADSFLHYCITHNVKGDPQAPNSPSVYDFPDFLKLSLNLLPKLNDILDMELAPTYTYARVYGKGEVLHRHKDRSACEYSLTMNLYKTQDWPIWIQSPNGVESSVHLNQGDAMVYKGCEADHWREPFQGGMCIQLFMHYVDLNGPRAWAYFDKDKFRDVCHEGF